MRIINLITDKGLEYFQELTPNPPPILAKGTRILVQTHDQQEHLGIFVLFENTKQSFKLQAIEANIIIDIPSEKISNIYQSLNTN